MSAKIEFPPYAYIPGMRERHADGAFDSIRSTANADMSANALAESRAFQFGLAYMEAEYFWEAHEVLEPVWMALDEGCDERAVVQALIQLANGRLKLEMSRPKAALRLCGIIRELLTDLNDSEIMTVSIAELIGEVDSLERESKMKYNALNII